jgi:hypothetical protein
MRDRWETSDSPIVHKIQEYGPLSLPLSSVLLLERMNTLKSS